jgi:EAL domain-containing protein (putative c-di-GMP-specific phosphodiesterase class I)
MDTAIAESSPVSMPQSAKARPRVLVADDEAALVRATARILTSAGYDVTTAANGREAFELLARTTFDVIVSDISMPELDGIQLLRTVRQRDLDVPVVLMTGAPDVATAVQAIAHGALHYLTKPVDALELRDVVQRAVRLHQIARVKREALILVSEGGLGISDRVGLEASFDRALETLWMAYQPIVRAADRTLFGYEALLRSGEKSLPHPGAILDAAERLGRLPELGRKIRATAAASMPGAPKGSALFVNLHARDLMDGDLLAPSSALSAIADQVVLEITERASLDEVPHARAKIAELRRRGFRIAIDDLGAGYAGLTSFVALEPELVKLDMSLVRDVERTPTKQKLIRSMATLCKDLGIIVVAEGVETAAERDCVVELGCDLLQGYLHGKPGLAFPEFVW